MEIQSSVIPLQPINDAITNKHGVRLFVLRLDLNHPYISGNKLFKLKYNIEEARKQGKDTILTFGGAFSNHIAATAATGKEYSFITIGIIRGEEHKELNPTLKFAVDCGMQIHYISREEYRNKTSEEFIDTLNKQFNNFFLIPEGGSNELGILGCKEIIQNIPIDFDYVCCPCGTGATLTGIILSLGNNQTAIGFQVLKAENYIKNEVIQWLEKFNSPKQNNFHIEESYHFGGYAKVNSQLIEFASGFEKENNIPLDYIYTGKMMFGIYDMIEKGHFEKGKTIIAIHTGGIWRN